MFSGAKVKRRFWLYTSAATALPLAFQVLTLAVLYWQLDLNSKQLAQLRTEQAVMAKAESISNAIRDSNLFVLIYSGSRSEFAVEKLSASLSKVERDLVEIKAMRSQGDLKSIEKLEKSLTPALESFRAIKEQVFEFENSDALPLVLNQINSVQDLTEKALSAFQASHLKRQAGLEKERARTSQFVTMLLASGLFVNVLVAALTTLFVSRFIGRRLDVVVDNAYRLSVGTPLAEPLTGISDEISHLDSSFHEMARALASAERRERDMIDNSVDVICSLDRSGMINQISAAAEQVIGYPPDQLRGRRLVSLLTEDSRERTSTALTLSVGEPDGRVTIENQIKARSGVIKDMLWSGRWNADNSTFFIVGHDITERKQAERLKRDIVAMVSHDIRSPLMTVDNSLDLLSEILEDRLDDMSKGILVRAKKAGVKIITLAQDLLELDKIESGMLELYREEVEVMRILSDAVELVSGSASEKKIEIEIVLEDGSARCDCDHRRIVQVLVNLLSNALKFAPKGGRVAASALVENDSVVFFVEDNGPGIPSDVLPYVFDRYRQVHKEGAGRVGGTGLGLTICTSLVSLHGGEIWVNSVEGEGTRFSFSLPKDRKDLS